MKITCVRTMALSTVILIMASSIAPAQKTGMAQAVSIVQLIATPEKYNGQGVLVGGFLRLEFEGNAFTCTKMTTDIESMLTLMGEP